MIEREKEKNKHFWFIHLKVNNLRNKTSVNFSYCVCFFHIREGGKVCFTTTQIIYHRMQELLRKVKKR